MAYLIDTNLLVRLANATDPSRLVVARAVFELHRRGEALHITPQNLIEFHNVATRPVAVNGLGLSAVDAKMQAAGFEATFPLLPDTPDIYPAWRAIVAGLAVVGKQVHDARLVGVCHAHGVTHLLTFDDAHFTRLAGFGPGVTVVHPTRV